MEKKVLYFDLDGVLADFVQGYKQAFGRNAYSDDSFTISQFCKQVPNFFRMLPIHEKGIELFNALKDDYDIKFLTTPMAGMPFCKRDKVLWVLENIGQYDVLFSDSKADYVIDNESILIDDMDYNLDLWESAGGTAIKFPQKINDILGIIDNVFNPKEEPKIKKQLKEIIVNLKPSDAQIEAGNYKKSDIMDFKGLKIRIENPKGSIRTGFSDRGVKWISKMKNHYGYITGTEGADYDEIDCFIGDELNRSLAFVINQGFDGMFDESKVMLGFTSIEEAESAYLSNYQKGWKGLMSIVQTNTKKIREWIKTRDTKEPFK